MVDLYRFLLVAGLLETFSKDSVERVEEKATRSLFCKSVRHFLVKMSLWRATVRPYLVDGKAVFVNRKYGRLRKLDVILFISGTTIRSLKVKQSLF